MCGCPELKSYTYNILFFFGGGGGQEQGICNEWRLGMHHPVLLVNPFLFIRGLSCPSSIQASLSLNCLQLTIPGFLHNRLLASVATLVFLKNSRSNIGLEIRPQSAFLHLGHSCPLQTILLNDLVGCDSPLQMVMAFWRAIIVSRGLSHPTQKVWILTQKGAKLSLLSAEGCDTQMDGQHCLW
jgi:hypothetical protein